MAKGPGMYSDIGKGARDLLNKDYFFDHKFTVSTTTSSGLTFTSTGTRKGEALGGEVNTQFKHQNVTTDFKVDTKSNIHAIITADEVSQGLKTILSFTLPDASSGKVEAQFSNENAGVTAAVGLTASPIVDVTAAFGNRDYSLGGVVSFDTANGNLKKYEAGVSFSKWDFTGSVILADKGDTLKASYSHTVNPLTKAIVGAEAVHSMSNNTNTFTVGGAYSLDLLTTVKARIDNKGKLGTVIQHEFRPKSFFTVSGEVDTKVLQQSAKVGFALALKP